MPVPPAIAIAIRAVMGPVIPAAPRVAIAGAIIAVAPRVVVARAIIAMTIAILFGRRRSKGRLHGHGGVDRAGFGGGGGCGSGAGESERGGEDCDQAHGFIL